MGVRRKTFSLLTVVLVASIITYIWWYSHNDYKRMQREFHSLTQNYQHAFNAEFASVRERMLQLAIFTANDERVQQFMRAAVAAVTREGGGSGGAEAARIRQQLFAYLNPGVEQLSRRFNIVLLHFHLMPDAVSFLRFHHPDAMGDSLVGMRPMIVAAGTGNKSVTGFETGRYFSGIRAAVPIYAFEPESGIRNCVGVVEFGIPVVNLLRELHAKRPWLESAVLLDDENLRNILVPEKYAQFSGIDTIVSVGRRLDLTATTSDKITDFLRRSDFRQHFQQFNHFIFSDSGFSYNSVAIPLSGFAIGQPQASAPVGAVVLWQDVSAHIAAHKQVVKSLIVYGVLLFAVLEVCIYLGIYIVSAKLKQELEYQRRLKRVSGRALEAVGTIGLPEQQPLLQLSRVLQDQLNDAVSQLKAELGMFITTDTGPDQFRIVAVSEMAWSSRTGACEYNHARNQLLQQGYVPIHLGESLLARYLRAGSLVSLNEEQCESLVAPFLPEGHPRILNLLFVPVQIGGVQLGALILGNSASKFAHNEQIVAQTYAAAAALLMHSDLREVERLSAMETARVKEDLLRNMAHELRTPLHIIHGMSQNLQATSLDAMQQHYLRQVQSGVRRLTHLVDEVFSLAALDSAKHTRLELQPFRPESMLQSVADEFEQRARTRGITLKLQCIRALPAEFTGPADKIAEVLRQLLDNAIKFSRDAEVILGFERVEADAGNAQVWRVRFWVTDHGIGIGTEQQAMIFEPFYQCDTSRAREYEGAGLGLSVAQKVCETMDSTIRVQSSIGSGSTFCFELLVHAGASNALSPDSAADQCEKMQDKVSMEACAYLNQQNGTIDELRHWLRQLEEPLQFAKPGPCNDIVALLQSTVWPEWLAANVVELLGLMRSYRYTQALQMVRQMQEEIEFYQHSSNEEGALE